MQSLFRQSNAQTILDQSHSLEFNYEWSCWIDGVTRDTAEDFKKAYFESTMDNGVIQSRALVAAAWRKVGMTRPIPHRTVTPLLIRSLHQRSRYGKEFVNLTAQVTLKSLLFLRNPLPLAAVVVSLETDFQSSSFDQLATYAHFVLFLGERNSERHRNLTCPILSSLLDTKADPVQLIALTPLPLRSTSIYALPEDCIALFRAIWHFYVTSLSTPMNRRLLSLVVESMPTFLNVGKTFEIIALAAFLDLMPFFASCNRSIPMD